VAGAERDDVHTISPNTILVFVNHSVPAESVLWLQVCATTSEMVSLFVVVVMLPVTKTLRKCMGCYVDEVYGLFRDYGPWLSTWSQENEEAEGKVAAEMDCGRRN
jgi:hypothetical protein